MTNLSSNYYMVLKMKHKYYLFKNNYYIKTYFNQYLYLINYVMLMVKKYVLKILSKSKLIMLKKI